MMTIIMAFVVSLRHFSLFETILLTIVISSCLFDPCAACGLLSNVIRMLMSPSGSEGAQRIPGVDYVDKCYVCAGSFDCSSGDITEVGCTKLARYCLKTVVRTLVKT